MNKSLADKIVLPEFPDDVFVIEEGRVCGHTIRFLFMKITVDCISRSWRGHIEYQTHEDCDWLLCTDCVVAKSNSLQDHKVAYHDCIKQLQEKYKQWVMKNILFEE